MDLKKKQNIMYRVHRILIFLKIYVPRYMKFDFFSLLAHGGEARVFIYFYFWHFFSTCEKIIQFLEFCKDQGGKI